MILAIINNKGGVLKTTTAVSLAAGLSLYHGLKTLLVDLDAQASASVSVGVEWKDLSPSSADLVLKDVPAKKLIRGTSTRGMDLITGSMDLVNADLALSDVKGRERQLKKGLDRIRKDYDFIVIDTPPSIGVLSLNALVAADSLLVPVLPQYLSLLGLASLNKAISRIEKGIGIKTEVLGYLLTLVDYREKVTREIVEQIRAYYGATVMNTEIKVNVRMKEAPSFGKTIFEYDNACSGAHSYRELALEVLERSKAMKENR